MFLLQPLLARILLPAFGGSPAVWNTCMVFFQVLLLSGYAYAHESVRRFGIARQMLLHAAIVLGSVAMLPHALSPMPVDTAHPELALLRLQRFYLASRSLTVLQSGFQSLYSLLQGY